MNSLKHLRNALLLAAAVMYLGNTGQLTAAAGNGTKQHTVVAATMRNTTALSDATKDEYCDEICGPTVDCDTFCHGDGIETPYNTSCLAYYDGVFDGWCAGVCDDGYCNTANGEDASSCYEDCGYCGDHSCDGTEDLDSCPQDCHGCPDGVCSGAYETCESCAEDCNPTNDTCGPDDPGETDGCDEGEAHNGAGYCCTVELLYEGLASCNVCGTRQCVVVLSLGEYIGWGCIGKGQTCEGT